MGQSRDDFVEKLYRDRQSVLTKTAQRLVTALQINTNLPTAGRYIYRSDNFAASSSLFIGRQLFRTDKFFLTRQIQKTNLRSMSFSFNKRFRFVGQQRMTKKASRAGEFHPHPLTEPYVKLSLHTALPDEYYYSRL